MSWIDYSYKSKKVMTIGTVKELTGLTERRIRYYEERKLIFPERSKAGMRRYSFLDIELLAIISNKIEKGTWTNEIKKEVMYQEQLTHSLMNCRPLLKNLLNRKIHI
ncbi:MAG: MerR family transcriptional regulator [Bacillus sp. (in: firmicutes)]